jgi:hypothetical protein
MVIIKTPKTFIFKSKVRKFNLRTEIEPEEISLIDEENKDADHLYNVSKINIEECNKRLEKARLLMRSIECSANRNFQDISKNMIQEKVNRTNGYYLSSIDSKNGIYIH